MQDGHDIPMTGAIQRSTLRAGEPVVLSAHGASCEGTVQAIDTIGITLSDGQGTFNDTGMIVFDTILFPWSAVLYVVPLAAADEE